MKRQELRNIIAESAAATHCEPVDIQRLVDTADNVDVVLVGEFNGVIDGKVCGCPATLAGYWDTKNEVFKEGTPAEVQKFTSLFDSRFGHAHTPDSRPAAEESPDGVFEFVRIED